MEDEILYTVDRFEGNYAVCENRATGQMVNIDTSKLPTGIKEGSLLIYKDGIFQIDKEIQKEIEERINKKINELWN